MDWLQTSSPNQDTANTCLINLAIWPWRIKQAGFYIGMGIQVFKQQGTKETEEGKSSFESPPKLTSPNQAPLWPSCKQLSDSGARASTDPGRGKQFRRTASRTHQIAATCYDSGRSIRVNSEARARRRRVVQACVAAHQGSEGGGKELKAGGGARTRWPYKEEAGPRARPSPCGCGCARILGWSLHRVFD